MDSWKFIEALNWLRGHVWSWQIVSWLSPLLYGFGLAAMFGNQYILAAVLYFIAIAYLTAKAIAWKHTPGGPAASLLILLIGALILAFSLLWIRHTRRGRESFQGIASLGPPGEPKPTAPQTGWMSQLTEGLGGQHPRIVNEGADLLSPEGFVAFRFIAGQVEGRRVFGRRLLVDVRSEETNNRLLTYFHTVGELNYLTLEIFTLAGQRYAVSYSVSDWKNNQSYHIIVTWDLSGDIKLYIDGELRNLMKAEGQVFERRPTTTVLVY